MQPSMAAWQRALALVIKARAWRRSRRFRPALVRGPPAKSTVPEKDPVTVDGLTIDHFALCTWRAGHRGSYLLTPRGSAPRTAFGRDPSAHRAPGMLPKSQRTLKAQRSGPRMCCRCPMPQAVPGRNRSTQRSIQPRPARRRDRVPRNSRLARCCRRMGIPGRLPGRVDAEASALDVHGHVGDVGHPALCHGRIVQTIRSGTRRIAAPNKSCTPNR